MKQIGSRKKYCNVAHPCECFFHQTQRTIAVFMITTVQLTYAWALQWTYAWALQWTYAWTVQWTYARYNQRAILNTCFSSWHMLSDGVILMNWSTILDEKMHFKRPIFCSWVFFLWWTGKNYDIVAFSLSGRQFKYTMKATLKLFVNEQNTQRTDVLLGI